MRQKKSEQQHYHSRDDDDDHLSSATALSSYIQLRSNPPANMLTAGKLKQSRFHFARLRSLMLVVLLSSLVLLLTLFVLYPKEKHTRLHAHHRLKRQLTAAPAANLDVNDKRHYTKMLRGMLSYRSGSSVLADCTINRASDGIYNPPSANTLSSETIHLVERTFQGEFSALKHTAGRIRQRLNESSDSLGDYALAKFYDKYSIQIKLLLANQLSIKEINIMLVKPLSDDNNGGSYVYYDTIKYYRSDNDSSSAAPADYYSIHGIQLKQNRNFILQTFTAAAARETLKSTRDNSNNSLFNDGWWIGPVLCEINKNETFLMAHIFPLTIK